LITSIAQKAGFGGGIVVDYPNSKKAKKVFLCLLVGGGGGQQEIPKGLEGAEEGDSKVRFERRRERERLRGRSGIRKKVKDKDWILKKKEVNLYVISSDPMLMFLSFSCTEGEARRMYPEILNTQDGNASRFSRFTQKSCSRACIHSAL
jgi:hypothetical protein